MPLFSYQVMDKAGSEITGKLEAEHEMAAASRLQKMGYTVLEIEEQKASSSRQIFSRQKKVTISDLCFFTRQLAAMLKAGIPLTRTLFALSEQTKNPTLSNILGEMARNVEGGISFYEALCSYPNVFSTIYVEMVKAGEIGGAMDEMLLRLSQQLERDKSLRDNIRSATFYPAIVLLFAFLVVLLMMLFVIPIFSNFFPPGVEMPIITSVIMGISESLRTYWYIHLIGLILFILIIRIFAASEAGRMTWERIKFKLPVFGELFKKVTIARFCRIMATLLAGGIPVIQALETAGPTSGSAELNELVKEAGADIHGGQSIVEPLEKSDFFPPMLTNMVAVGEETGELSPMLAQVADFYEEEVATMTKGLTALLEPLLLIVIGCTIGGIVIAIYLPIFNAVTSIGG
ncbi:MAG: type II secretion system F family protein [Firmicutes bacterium]|nr:type II secretion system F family protein [Bacillota bacterium]